MIFLNDYVFEIWNNNGVRANDEKLSGAFPRSKVGERKLLHFSKKKKLKPIESFSALCALFSRMGVLLLRCWKGVYRPGVGR